MLMMMNVTMSMNVTMMVNLMMMKVTMMMNMMMVIVMIGMTKTALMVKHARWNETQQNFQLQGLDQGLVASLLSMRGDLRGWGLGNIQETEDETLV